MATFDGWEDQFRDSEIHQKLSELGGLVSKVSSEESTEYEWLPEFCRRIDAVITLVQRTLDNTIAILAPEPVMRQVTGALQDVINALNAFSSDPPPENQNHLGNVEGNITTIVQLISQLPVPAPQISGDVFSSTLRNIEV